MRDVVLVDAQRFAYGVKGDIVREIIFVAVFEYSLDAGHVQLASRRQLAHLRTFPENQAKKHFSQAKSVFHSGFCAGNPVEEEFTLFTEAVTFYHRRGANRVFDHVAVLRKNVRTGNADQLIVISGSGDQLVKLVGEQYHEIPL